MLYLLAVEEGGHGGGHGIDPLDGANSANWQSGVWALGIFILLVLPTGMIMGYVFNATGGSLLIVHLLHQSINGWSEGARIFPVFTGGTRQVVVFALIASLFGVAATVGLWRQGVRKGKRTGT